MDYFKTVEKLGKPVKSCRGRRSLAEVRNSDVWNIKSLYQDARRNLYGIPVLRVRFKILREGQRGDSVCFEYGNVFLKTAQRTTFTASAISLLHTAILRACQSTTGPPSSRGQPNIKQKLSDIEKQRRACHGSRPAHYNQFLRKLTVLFVLVGLLYQEPQHK